MYKFIRTRDNNAKMRHFWKDGKRYVQNFRYDNGPDKWSSYTEQEDELVLLPESHKRNISAARFIQREYKDGEPLRLLRVTQKDGICRDFILADGIPFNESAVIDLNSIGFYESDGRCVARPAKAELPE